MPPATEVLRKAPSSHYLTALRRLEPGARVPAAILLEGDPSLAPELESRAAFAIDPTEVRTMAGADDLAKLGLDEPGGRKRLLVLWRRFEEVRPGPETTAALLRVRPSTGTFVVATCAGTAPEPWGWCFDWKVYAALSPKQARTLMQTLTGGLHADAAQRVLDRSESLAEAMAAARTLRALTERATAEDVDTVVAEAPERRLARALVACDRREALSVLGAVGTPLEALERLEADALSYWVLAENAALLRRVRANEAESVLGLPPGTVDRLGPYVRLWSRQKVGERLVALAAAHERLRAGMRAGVLEALVLGW